MKKLNILEDSVSISLKDLENLQMVLNKSQLSIFNSEVIESFQENFFKFLCNNRLEGGIVALPNCTSAIFIALQMLDLKPGDEIIVPNLTHSSSIYPILYMYNCKIKVCDFSDKSYEMNIDHLKSLISEKTKAVIVCYLHGYPTNIKEILKICEDKNIKLIEDAAQGLGVKIQGKKVGIWGHYSCFSFGENKLLRMGEGGALKYNNDKEKEQINRLRHVGEVWKESGRSTISNDITYKSLIEIGIDYKGMGFNYRVNPVNIALGLEKLENLDKIISVRQKKLEIYKKNLNNIEGVKLINDEVDNTAPISAWYVVDSKVFDIKKIILKCLEYGIPVGRFKYNQIIKIEAFEKYILNLEDDFKNSCKLQQNSLFFPLYENINIEEIEIISAYLRNVFLNYNNLTLNENILNEKVKYFDGFFIK